MFAQLSTHTIDERERNITFIIIKKIHEIRMTKIA